MDAISQYDEDTFCRLTPTFYLQRFHFGVHLFSEGEMAGFLHVVVEGSVVLFASYLGYPPKTCLVPSRPANLMRFATDAWRFSSVGKTFFNSLPNRIL